eukprot:4554979-Pyramimonas_sp.AAC.1
MLRARLEALKVLSSGAPSSSTEKSMARRRLRSSSSHEPRVGAPPVARNTLNNRVHPRPPCRSSVS